VTNGSDIVATTIVKPPTSNWQQKKHLTFEKFKRRLHLAFFFSFAFCTLSFVTSFDSHTLTKDFLNFNDIVREILFLWLKGKSASSIKDDGGGRDENKLLISSMKRRTFVVNIDKGSHLASMSSNTFKFL
jgi:hypothetical protein